jgi:hypothetical protein
MRQFKQLTPYGQQTDPPLPMQIRECGGHLASLLPLSAVVAVSVDNALADSWTSGAVVHPAINAQKTKMSLFMSFLRSG